MPNLNTFSTHRRYYSTGWYSFGEPRTIGSFYIAKWQKYVAGDETDARRLRIPAVKTDPISAAGSGDGDGLGNLLVEPIDLGSIVLPAHDEGVAEDAHDDENNSGSFTVLNWVADNIGTIKAGKDFDNR
jgi:hypothetical protein